MNRENNNESGKKNSFSKMNDKNNNKSGNKIPSVKWMGKIIINLEIKFLQ